MAVSQSLTLTETSYSTSGNSSQVRILWTSTQTGESYNNFGVRGYYYVSINGGQESPYEIPDVDLSKNATVTILNTTITVPHRDDGTGSISVRTRMDTNISAGIVTINPKTLNLTTIARASAIDSVSNQNLGASCSVKWTPKSSSFRFKLKFSMGSWSETTGIIHPNMPIQYTYSGYTIPLEAARQIPNSKTGTMTVTLYTYRDSNATNLDGSASETFTVTVPENASTKPTVTMTLSKEDSLGDAFNGVYIQGNSKVKATFSDGSGKFGASIVSYSINVEDTDIGDPYTSNYLNNPGEVWVVGKVTDSRGISNTTSKKIIVTAYTNPRVVPVEGETNVVCGRCDDEGNWSDSGTYLKIKAKRSYSKCNVDGVQKNFCGLRYRYKNVEDEKYSDWIELLAPTNLTTDEVIICPCLLLDNSDDPPPLILDVTESYLVQVGAIDSVNNDTSITFTIPTDKVYLHKAGSIRSLGIGTYVDEPNTVLIADDMTFKASAFNGVYMGAKVVSEVNNFDIQSKFSAFTGSGNGNERQTFFIFGEANGKPVYGLARVSDSGTTLWQGTEGVTLSSKIGGILTVTLPTVAYDMFTVISCRKFTL